MRFPVLLGVPWLVAGVHLASGGPDSAAAVSRFDEPKHDDTAQRVDKPRETNEPVHEEGSQDSGASRDRVDDILTKLEKRGDDLKDIRCRVKFVEQDRINLATRTKVGEILFLMVEPNPYFMIHFERTEADGLLGKQEWYLFDGRWLYEAIERLPQVTKREIARPGDKLDMFNLETAPFPLPFGQKKDKILRNFDVTLADPAPGDPKGTDHLICIPKADSVMAERYEKLEFFVRRDVHLPSRIVVTKNKGLEISTADFPDLSAGSIDTGITKEHFQKPAAWKTYPEVIELLEPTEPSRRP